ncbi:MAG: hypothetical protein WBQ34_17460 [Candidatus Acidiferrales bacterium]
MNLAHCGLLILLAAPFAAASARPLPARRAQSAPAQDAQTQTAQGQSSSGQTDSLAAAARRAREKQKEQPKPAKVWDNDNIPTSGGVAVIGSTSQGSAATSAAGPAETSQPGQQKSATSKSAKKTDFQGELKSASADLKNLQTQLDFLQRKFALDQQSFYQNPNYSSDTAGAKALQDEQDQIDAKKQDVAASQKIVDDLTAKADAQTSGSNSSAAK